MLTPLESVQVINHLRVCGLLVLLTGLVAVKATQQGQVKVRASGVLRRSAGFRAISEDGSLLFFTLVLTFVGVGWACPEQGICLCTVNQALRRDM